MSKTTYELNDKQSAIVFLSIALALFLAFIGFFAWHTDRMRRHELEHVKIYGTVVDMETQHGNSGYKSSSRTYYYLVIAYTYDDQEYKFTDNVGNKYSVADKIGYRVEIYVDPQNPSQAERVMSAGVVSIICACFFAFFCVTYAAGMNILLSATGSSFKKRSLLVWGVEIILGLSFLLFFKLGLPHSGFGEVFARIEGAVGLTVITGLVLLVTLLDGVITHKLRSVNGDTKNR